MKKLLIIMMLFYSLSGLSQIRHAQGLKGIHVGYTHTDLGSGISGGYLMYLNKFSLYSNVTADFGTEINNRTTYGLVADVGAGYGLVNLGNTVFFNTYGGGSISYDKVENAESYPVGNGINYGVFLIPEVEYFINDTFSVLGKAPIRYLFSNAFGGLRVHGSIGLRYNF